MIESILTAAGAPDAEISARVSNIGPDHVANELVTEVACRAALLTISSDKFVIQFDLGFGEDRLGYHLTLHNGTSHVEKGWNSRAVATVRQDLLDLLCELFGPTGTHGATRELFTRDYSETDYSASTAAGLWPVVGAMSQRPKDLSELAARFGSDKWGGRWYTPHYQKHFEPFRELAVKVLEIGVGGYESPDAGGESLRMWKHYFRRGLIYGLDIVAKTGIEESRLRVLKGDQGDAKFLDSMARELGPFDIVIDDGSHIAHHIITSFDALFPHVRPGGLYVVEDLAMAYWPGWGGGPDPSAQYGSMQLIKDLLDGLHHQERIGSADNQPSMTESMVTGVHVYHNLVLIEKGFNTEQGSPEWLKVLDRSHWHKD
ncbi:class I SAM-dependent methyltransferase [Mycobacterium sp. NPDC051804]|uniref:class I SAM-dependent methyltransferase n=1 Tax=Mycobacterium sp. NPDC051804 TaxID=3364295 RepID=UPI0037A6767D